ncbi:hypothetical protein ACROYT_G043402 [Oculina patagonica]
MGIYLRHVLATIYVFVNITCRGHMVNCDHLEKQRISECRDKTGDCLAQRQDGERNNIQLRLPRLEGVKVGHTQEMELTKGSKHIVRTLSLKPPVFEIPNFFTDEECEMIIDLALEKGMRESPLTQDTDKNVDEDSWKDKLKDWDKNEDGFIDKTEALHLPGKKKLYFTEDDVLEMFKALDLDQDKDGRISLKELERTSMENINSYLDKQKLAKPRMSSHNSQQVWLWHDDDELLQYEGLLEDYHDRLEQLTKIPKPILQQSEPVQVVRYKEEGHYHCHHDSEAVMQEKPCCLYGSKDCRLCRYLTIMVFLNDVEEGGECTFPVADNTTFSWKTWSNESSQKCNMVKHCDKSNLVTKPRRGTALLWYNHVLDDKDRWLGNLDPFSYQGSCQVQKGEKWVAKIWVNIIGDGKRELRAWKMGHNWLAQNNYNKEIIHALQSDIYEEAETENRYTREKNGFESKVDVVDNVANKNVASSKEDIYGIKEGGVESEENYVRGHDEITNNEEATVESLEDSSEEAPKGPKLTRTETSSPLPLTEEQMTPKGPSPGQPPPQRFEGNRIMQSIMLLLEELDQVELEIIARNLHTKLKLVCVPLIVNPMGRI